MYQLIVSEWVGNDFSAEEKCLKGKSVKDIQHDTMLILIAWPSTQTSTQLGWSSSLYV